MSNKYIVKNCECFVKNGATCYNKLYRPCQDCTDCLIKQVIEKCKNIQKDHYWGMREMRFSQEILQLFEIEECE